MYILVQHTISDPVKFVRTAEELNTRIPPKVKLHHVFSTADGMKAVCLWEAPSIGTVKDLLEPALAKFGRNDYFEVPNKEGIVLPALGAAAV